MEERIILFKDYIGKEEVIVINTNAPKEEIENAIIYKNTARNYRKFDTLCDWEIIQNYLEEKGYSFCDLNVDEIYYW